LQIDLLSINSYFLPGKNSLSYQILAKRCSYMIAAEQKARSTYDNILRLIKDPEICDPIRFLRQREVVHFQRFGESLRIVQDHLDSKNFYAFNPEFDTPANCGCQTKKMQ